MMTAGFMIAGGLGSVLRFWLGNLISSILQGAPFPVSIMLINILGSFMLGIFTSFNMQNQMLSIIIGTGFFGGFTTFSTFSVEAVQLLAEKRLKAGAAYILITMICCIGGFWAGSLL
ncbi:camphor resistance protein CrcB [Bacillus glycinifermentans]|uniref:fluoride efflux transporter CrcB n=1 Tax=Bacillus glycinifermentans TaxID=1664069 RepID=UPI0006542F82|nr:fluoride efflux transporter CrcB [Bacillus glycinifermentans]KMM63574.1 camphor resistance protein CrcB [Bacillus glycinifermentans]MEC0493873.1 fluoride efflux transporter CrcB [Bacillus glycinifermentans]MEC0543304.1 fluoride efflux transporter CrcB [Bacillus glycinifermentans]